MSSAQVKPPPQSSPLLNLPPELRNSIYSNALISAEDTIIFCDRDDRDICNLPASAFSHYWQPPALLVSCREIRSEASSIYYAHNRFLHVDIDGWQHMLKLWLSALDPQNVRSLTSIEIDTTLLGASLSSHIHLLLHVWKILSIKKYAVEKDVLRMKVPVWAKLPGAATQGHRPNHAGLVDFEVMSVARMEKGRLYYDAVLEDDSCALMKEFTS